MGVKRRFWSKTLFTLTNMNILIFAIPPILGTKEATSKITSFSIAAPMNIQNLTNFRIIPIFSFHPDIEFSLC